MLVDIKDVIIVMVGMKFAKWYDLHQVPNFGSPRFQKTLLHCGTHEYYVICF